MWHSELVRTVETVSLVAAECNPVSVETMPAINEINAGEHDNLTYEQVENKLSYYHLRNT